MLRDRIADEMRAAMKAREQTRVSTLRMLMAAMKNTQVEKGHELDDEEVVEVIRKGIKRRRESIEMYTKGNRKDLADKETSEAAALEKYLPAQVSDEELRAAVRAAIAGGATQIGAVMGKVLPQFKGRADGGTINAIAREELSKQG